MKTLSLLCAAAAFALTGLTSLAAELKAGDPAPNFKLQGSDGKTYSLADFKGKQAVVIAWFPKAFTGGCTAECKHLKAEGTALKKFDVAYFTASVDSHDGEKGNAAFAKSLALDYAILSDPKKEFAGALGVLNERGMAARWTYYIGKDGNILHVDKAVKPATAATDIAAKLKELGIAAKK
ncbi:MAG: alkyl hydroperoxide reductase [Limisphaerales bacterium]|nr:MAG: alkyl hydroperoxide reductase [Limisphaerales bacterium]KAG0508833.1 MAG: alkyl hydroperoxide reductase [Limisphaerales bacterium]TXT49708.1 MAG: alkyl hydroperoxide reductase [Limisphaerales bacterium]